MVESYATEDDLRRAYGERITLVEESLKTSRLGLVNLRQSLLSLLRRAADLELQSKPVHKALGDNIQRQHGDLLRQQAILEQHAQDRTSLGSDLDQAMERDSKSVVEVKSVSDRGVRVGRCSIHKKKNKKN